MLARLHAPSCTHAHSMQAHKSCVPRTPHIHSCTLSLTFRCALPFLLVPGSIAWAFFRAAMLAHPPARTHTANKQPKRVCHAHYIYIPAPSPSLFSARCLSCLSRAALVVRDSSLPRPQACAQPSCTHAHSQHAHRTCVPRTLHIHTCTLPLTVLCVLPFVPLPGSIVGVGFRTATPARMRALACTHTHSLHANEICVSCTLRIHACTLPLTLVWALTFVPCLGSIASAGFRTATLARMRAPACTHAHSLHAHKNLRATHTTHICLHQPPDSPHRAGPPASWATLAVPDSVPPPPPACTHSPARTHTAWTHPKQACHACYIHTPTLPPSLFPARWTSCRSWVALARCPILHSRPHSCAHPPARTNTTHTHTKYACHTHYTHTPTPFLSLSSANGASCRSCAAFA